MNINYYSNYDRCLHRILKKNIYHILKETKSKLNVSTITADFIQNSNYSTPRRQTYGMTSVNSV